jgi:putative hydrolase, CocE/NonD family
LASLFRLAAIGALLGLASPGAAARDYPDVARTSVYVPVRDGTRLAVNIYRPAEGASVASQRLPVIFVFTPYRARFVDDKGQTQEVALTDQLALRSLIRAGYVVAVADIRGKGASFGARRGFQDRTEAQDGHDLIQWLAGQPFSSGKVGMIGCSYLGGSTFHTASTTPSALKAVFIGATDFDKYDFVRKGGITAQFNTRPDEPAEVDLASVPVDADKDGEALRAAVAQHAANTPMAQLWYGMPYRDSISPLTKNAFWDEVAVYRYAKSIRDAGIATYFWGNWHDEPTSHVILGAANLGGKLLVGPGDHCVPPAGFDFTGEIRRYFDHHLKGVDNGIEREPRATYWLKDGSEAGQYVRSEQLPGQASEALSFYLSGTGDETPSAEGRLSARAAPAGASTFTVDYDLPPSDYFSFWPGSLHGKGASFTGEPLKEPLKLVGFPVANVAMKADRPDANVFVYLEEIASTGDVEVISFGRLKLSNRKVSPAPYDMMGLPWHSGLKADAVPLAQGEVAHLSISMMPVSRIIPAGSRLRFVVAGADSRQRNLQEIKETPPPQLTVVHGWEAGSRIDLPLQR